MFLVRVRSIRFWDIKTFWDKNYVDPKYFNSPKSYISRIFYSIIKNLTARRCLCGHGNTSFLRAKIENFVVNCWNSVKNDFCLLKTIRQLNFFY